MYTKIKFNFRIWKTDNKVLQNYFDTKKLEISPDIETPRFDKVKMVGFRWKIQTGRLSFFFRDIIENYKAYGCCVYLKCFTKSNFISMSSVASNSEVTPCKEMLMRPRSELLCNFLFVSYRFNRILKRSVSNVYA